MWVHMAVYTTVYTCDFKRTHNNHNNHSIHSIHNTKTTPTPLPMQWVVHLGWGVYTVVSCESPPLDMHPHSVCPCSRDGAPWQSQFPIVLHQMNKSVVVYSGGCRVGV